MSHSRSGNQYLESTHNLRSSPSKGVCKQPSHAVPSRSPPRRKLRPEECHARRIVCSPAFLMPTADVIVTPDPRGRRRPFRRSDSASVCVLKITPNFSFARDRRTGRIEDPGAVQRLTYPGGLSICSKETQHWWGRRLEGRRGKKQRKVRMNHIRVCSSRVKPLT